MDFNGSGSLEMRYLNGPTGDLVDTIIARESAGGTVAWYLPDRLGTIRDLINNSGSIIDHVDYSAFGTVLDESSPSNADRMMGFGGMERDTVTGMNLAVNRVQDPGTGRWTSQDPLGFGGGDADLYRSVNNSPSNVIDPSGLDVTVKSGGNNRITIEVPIAWSGDGATPELIDKWTKVIEQAWTGKFGRYDVTCKVTKPKKGRRPNRVTVDIGSRPQGPVTYRKRTGLWPTATSPSQVAHEAGHLMRLDEAYDRIDDTHTVPKEGKTGNVMAQEDGIPFECDIVELIWLNNIGWPL